MSDDGEGILYEVGEGVMSDDGEGILYEVGEGGREGV